MGSEIWKPGHLSSGQIAAILSKPFEIQTGLYFEWFGFQIVGTIAILHVVSTWYF